MKLKVTKTKRKLVFSRHKVVLILFFSLFFLLIMRLWVLQNNNTFLQTQGDLRTIRTVPINGYRGMITDRFSEPLAISALVYSAWLNPQEYYSKYQDITEQQQAILDDKITELTKILHINTNDFYKRLREYKNKSFIYLKRHIKPTTALLLESLAINGLYVKKEHRRFYPEAELTSHVVGFTGIEDKGLEGLELNFDQWLRGEDGLKIVLQDRTGRRVKDLREIKPAKNGNDLQLSLNPAIQYIAYRELNAAVTKHKAKGGSIVVLDAATGEILAMVNNPSYNPNIRNKKVDHSYRNRAVTDLLEPGSVMKVFSMANVLEERKYPKGYLVDTSGGQFKIGNNVVKDLKNNKIIGVEDILLKSSNVGIAKLTLGLDQPDSLYNLLAKLGFGSEVTMQFPGESAGVLNNYDNWDPFVLATFSFGYAMSATVLQIAHAYATLANDGISLPVTFLYQDEHAKKEIKGERILSSDVAEQITKILTDLVEHGAHGRAKVLGYKVAGKTGTSRKVGEHGYEKRYHSLFAGYGPVDSLSRIVVVVMIDEPSAGQYYGSLVAAPVFAKVMGGALTVLEKSAVQNGRELSTRM